MPDEVEAAAADTPYDHYARRPDGSMIPQTTSPEVIADLLRLLEAGPGAHVLEIGTGSGYSTALLARLVGPSGRVTSIDIDPALTARARSMLSAAGFTNVSVHCTDGVHGCAAEAPYTHVVAWAAAEELPDDWVAQARPPATIVAPVELAPLARASRTVRVWVTGAEEVQPDGFTRASFVTLHPVVLTAWAVPARHVDVVLDGEDNDGSPPWLSAPWLRTRNGEEGPNSADLLLTMSAAESCPGPLSADEDAVAFEEFLLSLNAPTITQASLHDGDLWMGLASLDGFAMVLHPNVTTRDASYIVRGSPRWKAALDAAVHSWRAAGRPGIGQLRPRLIRVAGGWQVRARRADR